MVGPQQQGGAQLQYPVLITMTAHRNMQCTNVLMYRCREDSSAIYAKPTA